jgi:hypothetical protein
MGSIWVTLQADACGIANAAIPPELWFEIMMMIPVAELGRAPWVPPTVATAIAVAEMGMLHRVEVERKARIDRDHQLEQLQLQMAEKDKQVAELAAQMADLKAMVARAFAAGAGGK